MFTARNTVKNAQKWCPGIQYHSADINLYASAQMTLLFLTNIDVSVNNGILREPNLFL
jgi:hypothetical protein